MTKPGEKSLHDKFAELTRKFEEIQDKENLGALRGAVAVYQEKHGGQYPGDLQELLSNSVRQMPPLKLPDRPYSMDVEYYDDDVCVGLKHYQLDAPKLRNTGKWGYVRPRPGPIPGKPCVGWVYIDSARPAMKGKVWDQY